MIVAANNYSNKVRVLKKVRRHFLHKTPDEEEERAVAPLSVNPDTHYLASGSGNPIKASYGIVEVERKLRLGPEYLNLYFNVQSTIVENASQNKTITLILSPNENRPIIPWEYTAKRLESYGDLDLAMWAQRIKEHYLNYSQAIAGIHNQVISDNPEIQAWLRKLRVRAVLARREIESKCAYARCVQFFRKDSNQLLSYAFSENFLKQLGFTPETFIQWSRENGIPRILAAVDMYEEILKGVFTNMPKLSEAISESPESNYLIYTKDGSKTQVTMKYVVILDPTPKGMFYYCYLILCDTTNDTLKTLSLENSEGPGTEMPKKKMICGEDDGEGKENCEGQ